MADDAYEVLGLPASASEDAIRQRYLELVRQHPPDQDPERFAAIRQAYDHLRDPATRIERELFGPLNAAPLDDLELGVYRHLRSARLPVDVLLALAERS